MILLKIEPLGFLIPNSLDQVNSSRKGVWLIFIITKFYKIPGPCCSKLTTSLVNDSLKFTSSDMQIC